MILDGVRSLIYIHFPIKGITIIFTLVFSVRIFFFFWRRSFALVTQAGMQWCHLSSLQLRLLGSGNSPASASWVAGTTGMRPHIQLIFLYFNRDRVSPVWPTWWNPVSAKNTKISWAWWHTPIIPATWEAEAGESLEFGRQRLQWAKIVPLHCSLGNRARLCLKRKEKRF